MCVWREKDSHFKKQFGTGEGMLSSLFYLKSFFSTPALVCIRMDLLRKAQDIFALRKMIRRVETYMCDVPNV